MTKSYGIGESAGLGAEWRDGERSEPARNEAPNPAKEIEVPDIEVAAKAKRRRFSAAFKLRMVQEADNCTEPGAVGALLRREGLYSSQLTKWRRQRDAGGLGALNGRRGRKKAAVNPLQKEVNELQKKNRRLEKKLRQAELIIGFQKKVAEMLEIPLGDPEERN